MLRRGRWAREMRADLVREFGMPSNASYIRVGKMLAHARNHWFVQPPDTLQDALFLMWNEQYDRAKRLSALKHFKH